MIEAVGDNILVKPLKKKEAAKGIILPKTNKEYDLVEIISSGSNEFSKGEKVFLYLHCGNEIMFEGDLYYFINKEFVHGKINESGY